MKLNTEFKLGKVSKDLQAQFLYKLFTLKTNYNLNMKIILVSPIMSLLTKTSFDELKNIWTNNFNLYENVNMYNSKEHFNTSGNFPITVTLWSNK